ncbi:hypothetical protein AURDEDRAFT_156013 [Auricularia subglabra TFB-10046 SS5]|nr:hypothetical protein AURDEDRAFT_156013 [Auricularia subglabra TFB-10046 SS5]
MAFSHNGAQQALNDATFRTALHLWNAHTSAGNAETTSAAIHDVLQSIRKAISTRIRFSTHLKNALANLPLDVLRRLLEHAELVDRIALSQTCYSLRQHCLQIPSVWSTVSLHEDANICQDRHRSGLLPYYLVGSHRHSPLPTAPLCGLPPLLRPSSMHSLQLSLSAELCPLLVSLMQDVIGRTANVSLNVFAWCQVKQRQFSWDHYVEDSIWIPDRPWNVLLEELVNALRLPAPHLRSFSLTVLKGTPYTPVFETLAVPIDLLGGSPGQLHSCRVGGIWLQPVAYPAFSLVQVLEYAPIPANLRASELDCLLDGMAQLETLGITITSFDNDSRASFEPYHSRLRRVGFLLREQVDGHIREQSIEALRRCVRDAIFFCVERNVPEIAISRQWPNTLEWSFFPSFPASIEEGPEVVLGRFERYIILQPPIERSPDVFHNLTSLTIWSCFLRVPSLPASAPALRHLCVLCLACQKCAEFSGVEEGIWMSSWRVPSLRTLHVTGLGFCCGIAAPEGRYDCPFASSPPLGVPVSAVLRLLAVLRTKGRLARLTVSAVHLVDDRPRDLLNRYVDVVDILNQGPDAELLRVLEMQSRSGWDTPTQIFDPAFRPRDLAWAELRSPRHRDS